MITIIGTIVIVLVTITIGVLVDRRWDVIPRKEKLLADKRGLQLPGYAAGEAPATAIDASAGEIEREIERLRRKTCEACRGEVDVLSDDRVHYDDAELLVLHARCTKCGRTRATYVRPR